MSCHVMSCSATKAQSHCAFKVVSCQVNVDGDKLIWTEATKADLKSRKSHNEVLQKSLKRNSLMVTSTTASTAGGDRGQVGSFHSNPRKSVSGLSSLNAGHAGMGSADNSRIEVSRESSSSSLFSMDSSAADSAEEKFILLTNIVEVREGTASKCMYLYMHMYLYLYLCLWFLSALCVAYTRPQTNYF